ncbi:MAG: ribulose phosphate epimerase [Sulfobacillus benefaciens]|uniref:Ribulose phosphate epimerase n=1 Tax=Sulfobacillus benefaciens TaxID=453960 RepID=A0A2T2XC06_9FIRM|nr:MAG: ribulose phosphate epimerase [Sulfobacillus benefaciens]
MQFAFHGPFDSSPWLHQMRQGLTATMHRYGHEVSATVDAVQLVFHVVNPHRPRPFRRQSKAVFVVGIAEGVPLADSPLTSTYPVLLRSLSNLLIYGGADPQPWAYLVTPELGCYPAPTWEQPTQWFDALYARIAPLATSRLVIDNYFDWDLPAELAQGTRVTAQMRDASRRLDTWQLFPTPYPLQTLLPAEDYRHLQRVFGLGGISYGNLSARHDATRFWMSASGIDKGQIGTVSRDILLVTGYDPALNAMRLSVSPGSHPLRVSVDAVEHWGIYRSHPEIGAMIHIHAWVADIPSTAVNYPCGTVEMGQAMADLLAQDPHPERTIIGLRNHGITATGPDFPDILARLEGRVQTQVPMQ